MRFSGKKHPEYKDLGCFRKSVKRFSDQKHPEYKDLGCFRKSVKRFSDQKHPEYKDLGRSAISIKTGTAPDLAPDRAQPGPVHAAYRKAAIR